MKKSLPDWVLRIPNFISMTRLVLVLPLILAAIFQMPELFLLLFAGSLVTDFLDGFLARRLNAQSEWGARLDSWADALSWITFTGGAMRLWPEIMLAHALWMVAALCAFLIPGLYGLIKYHSLPGFHTWSAKAAMASMGISVLLLFSGISHIPFYVSVCLLGIVCVEETLMVHWLPTSRTDLRTAIQAWGIHKERGL